MRILSRWIILPLLGMMAVPLSAKDLTVSAAVGLVNSFKEIAANYEKQHPGITVRLNSAASGVLVQQMSRGAVADVLAVADTQSMDEAVENKVVRKESITAFASNRLVLILPRSSQAHLSSLQDLKQPAIQKIAMGNPKFTPIGRYAMAALKKADIESAVKNKLILTQNIRQSLDYTARGEVDAAFVFRTEAILRPNKIKIAIDVPTEKAIVFLIAAGTAGNQTEAQKFINFVSSPQSQQILRNHGFLPPR